MSVFVKNMRGEPLMACRPQKARKLLSDGKARKIGYDPFTIQLLVQTGEAVQDVTVGIDPGFKKTGLAILQNGNKIIAKGEIELRKNISRLMTERRKYRRNRRYRKTRYREQRSDNRKKEKGWLPPSLKSKIDATFLWVDKFKNLLPSPRLVFELDIFEELIDIENDETNLREKILNRDNFKCVICGSNDRKVEIHHVIYKSKGGSDRIKNLISICEKCHNYDDHKPDAVLHKLMCDFNFESTNGKTYMNILRKRVFDYYSDFYSIFGKATKDKREQLNLPDTHYNDAIAIAAVYNDISKIIDETQGCFKVKQVRSKKRKLHHGPPRKGIKAKRTCDKRLHWNTKEIVNKDHGKFRKNDKVDLKGQIGYISGFTEERVKVTNLFGQPIKVPDLIDYKVSVKHLKIINHNNNWVFHSQFDEKCFK